MKSGCLPPSADATCTSSRNWCKRWPTAIPPCSAMPDMRAWRGPVGAIAAIAVILCARGPVSGRQASPDAPPQLQPTIHAAVPENVDDYWFAPRPAAVAAAGNTALAGAAVAYAAGNFPAALTSARLAV